MVDVKNEVIEYVWKHHSSYSTKGEAQTKGTRLMLLINKPTKVIQDKLTKQYLLMVGYDPQRKSINMRLNLT